jgi:hypothetical protein
VMATTSSPAAAAAVTSSAGVSVPSDAVECACRSIRISHPSMERFERSHCRAAV